MKRAKRKTRSPERRTQKSVSARETGRGLNCEAVPHADAGGSSILASGVFAGWRRSSPSSVALRIVTPCLAAPLNNFRSGAGAMASLEQMAVSKWERWNCLVWRPAHHRPQALSAFLTCRKGLQFPALFKLPLLYRRAGSPVGYPSSRVGASRLGVGGAGGRAAMATAVFAVAASYLLQIVARVSKPSKTGPDD